MKTFATFAFATALLGAPVAAFDNHGTHGDHGEHGTHGDHQMADFSGIYAGSYTCQDGEHGFYLDLSIDGMDDENYQVSGVLGLYPTLAGADGSSGAVAGSFLVSGTVGMEDMAIALEPGDWIVQPEGYGAAHLEGTVGMTDAGAWQINGKPVVPGLDGFCDALIATQFLATAE